MSDTYRPRRVLAVLAALLLPAATCGIAPTLQDLVRRIERVEAFVHNAQLPPVLVDDHNIVVGSVMDYNELMAFASVPTSGGTGGEPWSSLYGPEVMRFNRSYALATIQFTPSDEAPVLLAASRTRLLTPARGTRQETWFETPDCSGQPWIERPFPGATDTVWRYVWLGPPSMTLYTADSDAPEEATKLRSRIQAGGTGVSECQPTPFPFFSLSVRMRPVADLSVYTPPFRIVDQRELWGW